MDGQPFYVVWSPENGPPRVRHQYRERAVSEATRLARQSPGSEFFVMMATDRFVKDEVQRTTLFRDDDGQIPF